MSTELRARATAFQQRAVKAEAEVDRLKKRLAVAERYIPTHGRHRYNYEAEHGPAKRPA